MTLEESAQLHKDMLGLIPKRPSYLKKAGDGKDKSQDQIQKSMLKQAQVKQGGGGEDQIQKSMLKQAQVKQGGTRYRSLCSSRLR